MPFFARLFGKKQEPRPREAPQVFFENTLTSRKEVFVPLKAGIATLYSCGPTVYSKAHIGNLRSIVFSDTVARTLEAAGYRMRRVINITDVGHMVGDRDDGEDRMAVGAAREKKRPEEIAERYAKEFIADLAALNVDIDEIRFPRATEYIKEQIALARTLEEKGFTYQLPDGLYFDTSRFPSYGKLGNLAGAVLKEGARIGKTEGKRNPSDFALWRTAKPGDLQQWDSPWGRGNPGWHIECSAMSRSLLGQEIDIHTGGEDLATVHHNNEIAQSEAASGRTFVRYWMHSAFLNMEGEKISKSLGNDVYLSDIEQKGYHPLSLRYFFLQAHYRTPLSFSWEALGSAASALERLWNHARELADESGRSAAPSEARDRFISAMRDDLATPQALGILWESLRSEDYSPEEKWGLIEDADAHLGLMLAAPPESGKMAAADAPEKVQELLEERESARKAKDYAAADRLRTEIENSGYAVEDGPSGPVLTKKPL